MATALIGRTESYAIFASQQAMLASSIAFDGFVAIERFASICIQGEEFESDETDV
jgi:hypothetical protein